MRYKVKGSETQSIQLHIAQRMLFSTILPQGSPYDPVSLLSVAQGATRALHAVEMCVSLPGSRRRPAEAPAREGGCLSAPTSPDTAAADSSFLTRIIRILALQLAELKNWFP